MQDVSFSVAAGEIFGILGPNGASKTTTVECAQGLRRADGGLVRVLGLDAAWDRRELRRRVGSQLQSSALPDRLKIWEALDLFASMTRTVLGGRFCWNAGVWRINATARSLICQAARPSGCSWRWHCSARRKWCSSMSSPRAWTRQDWRVASELIREIRDDGATVVLVTHCMDEAEQLCDRLAVIDHGRVIAQGTPQGLIAQSSSRIRIRFSTLAADVYWLLAIHGVRELTRRGQHVQIRGDGAVLALVASALVDHGIVPVDLRVEQPTLEDAYLQLTTRTRRGGI